MDTIERVVARAIDPDVWSYSTVIEISPKPQIKKRREKSLARAAAVQAALKDAGFAIVPVEPTDEICDAIYVAETTGSTSPEVYRAMIDAAEEGDE
jgi:formiminotetrahydrofolate cyclodeaminase